MKRKLKIDSSLKQRTTMMANRIMTKTAFSAKALKFNNLNIVHL